MANNFIGQPSPSILPEFFCDFILVNGKAARYLKWNHVNMVFTFLTVLTVGFIIYSYRVIIPFGWYIFLSKWR